MIHFYAVLQMDDRYAVTESAVTESLQNSTLVAYSYRTSVYLRLP